MAFAGALGKESTLGLNSVLTQKLGADDEANALTTISVFLAQS